MVRPTTERTGEITPPSPPELPEDGLQWSSVRVQETVSQGFLLKAAAFGVEGRHARDLVHACKWKPRPVAGEDGFASAFNLARFKRIWVDHSDYPIYQPGQITELNPKPSGYLSPITQTGIDALRVHTGQILMTCSGRSGSIGRTTYVSSTLENRIFSHDLIRIECNEPDTAGYLYAFLHTTTGRALIRSNEYGAMIPHIEPNHLEHVPVPNPPPILKKRIHDLVLHSYALRDESNRLLQQAEQQLYEALDLPPLRTLRAATLDPKIGVRTTTVSAAQLSSRLDAGYHTPLVDAIVQRLRKAPVELTTVGDSRLSERIILPGRFARLYVGEGQGTPLFGGKQLLELDPAKKKYLSLAKHSQQVLGELHLTENMILISRSGTVGKVTIVPKFWENWVASEHVIRVIPASESAAGYLYVFLASDYGRELIQRFSYGSTVPELDDHQVAQVIVPILRDSVVQTRINDLALQANALRCDAYNAEQQAIHIVDRDVIRATR